MTNNISPIRHGPDWEDKFDKIRDLSLDLFLRDGENMSIRDLAKKMGIAVGGLYRYVQDKRDLWFLCQNYVYEKMSSDFESIGLKEKGDVIKILTKIGNYLLDLAEYDYPRFRFMFLSEPPQSSKEKGEHELVCQKMGMGGMQNLIRMGIENGQLTISDDQINLYAKILWGFVLGPGTIISPLHDYFFINEPMGWKKKFRDEVIRITINSITD